jgi:hypothetical protein
MQYRSFNTIVTAVALLTLLNAPVRADSDDSRSNNVKAELEGFQEIPAVSSTGEGKFRARIHDETGEIEFELNYSGLQNDVFASHIHFAQKGVIGAIVIHLCGTGGKPACPGPRSGTVKGTLTAADVVAVPTQGIAAGEIDEVIEAIRAGKAYVNVHSLPNHGTGEIRAQLR